jgi:hypothetical protein
MEALFITLWLHSHRPRPYLQHPAVGHDAADAVPAVDVKEPRIDGQGTATGLGRGRGEAAGHTRGTPGGLHTQVQRVVQQGRLQTRGGAVGEVRATDMSQGLYGYTFAVNGDVGRRGTYVCDVRPARGLDGASYLPPDGELRWRWWQSAGGR